MERLPDGEQLVVRPFERFEFCDRGCFECYAFVLEKWGFIFYPHIVFAEIAM
jgi:hypothetical protein